jgi:hypothetical protein
MSYKKIEEARDERLVTGIGRKEDFHKERRLSPGLFIKRIGECHPDICGSACCKFWLSMSNEELETYNYHSSFADKIDKHGNLIFDKTCKHLDVKENKCKLWGSNKFPEVCRQFPTVNDYVYRNVMDKCTFQFVIAEDTEQKKEAGND